MKTIRIVAAQLFMAIAIFACNNSNDKQANKTDTSNKPLDTSSKAVVRTSSKDTSLLMLEAQFVEFSLGDASHYIFKDKSGKTWDFANSKDTAYKFGVELPAKEANEKNQGWASNKKLQGKWFELTYEYITQPQYQDGPMVKVPVIVKAVLK